MDISDGTFALFAALILAIVLILDSYFARRPKPPPTVTDLRRRQLDRIVTLDRVQRPRHE